MMYLTKKVSPLSLSLDEENPRFRIKERMDQEQIREYLLSNEDLITLARRIIRMNSLLPGERIIIFEDGDKKIVLEGNRRTAIYQMLLNRELIPRHFRTTFPVADSSFLEELESIPVDVMNSRDEAAPILAARHIEGVKQWSTTSKMRLSNELFEKGCSVEEISDKILLPSSQIRKFIVDYKQLLRGIQDRDGNPFDSIDYLSLKPDKMLRIFKLSDTTETLQLFQDDQFNTHSRIYSDETIDAVFEKIGKLSFIENKINTRSTYDDVKGYLEPILAEDEPTHHEGQTEHTGNGTATTPPSISEGPETTPPVVTVPPSVPPIPPVPEPYFFEGLDTRYLDPANADTHGVLLIAKEIIGFSTHKLVGKYPLAASFLTRNLIEQSLIYYAKMHDDGNTGKRIISRMTESNGAYKKLSQIIDQYLGGLSNYIHDINILQYFQYCFSAQTITDPLNWVIHRTSDFTFTGGQIEELPKGGLLAIINYLLG